MDRRAARDRRGPRLLSDVVWYPRTGYCYPWECPFEHTNPVPEPECECFDDNEACPCCRECDCEHRDWEPTIRCGKDALVRVMLPNGLHFECCSPEAHGLPVEWWAPVYNQPDFRRRGSATSVRELHLETIDRMLKYVYKEQRIEELTERTSSPFLSWIPPGDGTMKYGVIPLD
jgi:hypothetical protein